MLSDLGRDSRYAIRTWRRNPGFAIVAVLTLALGIGAATAVFSIVEAILLRPLPYPGADRIVAIWDGHITDRNLAKIFTSYDDFENWRSRSESFERIAAATWATGEQILTGYGGAKIVLAIPVSTDFFSMLGVAPAMGRTFEPADLRQGCTVVLAHRFWRSTLSSRADIVGRSLAVGDRACTVAGVMPDRFAFYPTAADMWTLITPNREQLPKDRYQGVGVFGRLRPGVTGERAQAEVEALHRQQHAHDLHGRAFAPTVYPLQEEFTWLAGRNLRVTIWMLFAAVNGVLLIACVNVANLLLARALVRQREFAIWSALGSGRWRVARQVLTEAAMLGACASAAGVLLAEAAIRYLRASAPVELPPGVVLTVNVYVLAFAIALAMLTTLFFGVAPAWRAARADVSGALMSTSRTVAGRPAGHRAGRILIGVQMACAMALVIAATLLGESIVRLGSAPLGFNPDGLLTFTVRLPQTKYASADRRADFYRRIVAALDPLPGAQGVAVSTTLLRGRTNSLLLIDGRPDPTPDTSAPDVGQDFVSADYFRVLGVPLRLGRDFELADRQETAAVSIVNEALARKYFSSGSPIGQRIRTPNTPWSTVVGVVGNQKTLSVYQEMNWIDAPLIYRPLTQNPPPEATVAIRTPSPEAIGATVQRLVAAIDADVPLTNLQTMRQRISKDLAYPQFRAAVLGGFSAFALLLAFVGLYAVLSQLVAQRTHEFGVRLALGASSRHIARLVGVQGGVPTVIGLAIGMSSALAFERSMSSLLYGVKAVDPTTLGSIGALLLTLALAAMFIPARRATSVDPMTALRSE
jgi:predicted permease